MGTVRIGVLPSTAHPLVSTLYFRLKEAFPLVKLVVREGQGSQPDSWLDSGLVDLALMFHHGALPREGESWLISTDTFLMGGCRRRASSMPDMTRYIALALSPRAPLTLACRTVKQLIEEIVKDLKAENMGPDALSLSNQ